MRDINIVRKMVCYDQSDKINCKNEVNKRISNKKPEKRVLYI